MPTLTKWLIRPLTLLLGAMVAGRSAGQDLTLEKAYDLATQNYPAIKQRDLVRQTAALSIRNLDKELLPQFSVNGQATYQSDVTKIEFTLPGFSLAPLSKDQYRLYAEANQLIFDGGLIRGQKEVQRLSAAVEQERIDVDLHQLKERINQLYLGVLYLDEQLKQSALIKQDLATGMKRVEAQLQNGTAFRSALNLLKAESLKADQRIIEIQASRKGLLDVLALFINQPIDEHAQLQTPQGLLGNDSSRIDRPELRLFTAQSRLLAQQNNIIHARNLPRVSAFLQGGYGRPGLNQLKNEFDPYYIGGIRLNWSLGGFYTSKREKELVGLNQKTVAVQQETFLLNLHTQLKQQEAEITKLRQLIATDDGIIDLRAQVKDAAKAQLENGVISANDYLREVNAEDQARQTRIAHQVQLLQALINYQTITGKQ